MTSSTSNNMPLTIAPDHFPQRLASLDFTGEATCVDGKLIEYIIPPLCQIPAGSFLMGSDPNHDSQLYDDEKPQHTIILSAYQIARYPVTVAEYAYFVRAGHRAPQQGMWRPITWEQQLQHLDHPVVCVSWRDAISYAGWLTEHTKQPWHLPSEAEWEKAARGTDGRIYPWGDSFDQRRCNTSESNIGSTTPIDAYPSGVSPSSVFDLAGNVWEWTSSAYREYPYDSADGREDVDFIDSRVLHGGSWVIGSTSARAAYRCDVVQPDEFGGSNGFRLVVASPSRDAGD